MPGNRIIEVLTDTRTTRLNKIRDHNKDDNMTFTKIKVKMLTCTNNE